MTLDSFPQNSDGKIDRAQQPGSATALDGLQRQVVEPWKTALQGRQFAAMDAFRGGHPIKREVVYREVDSLRVSKATFVGVGHFDES